MALAQATVRAETKMLANFIVAVLWCIRLLFLVESATVYGDSGVGMRAVVKLAMKVQTIVMAQMDESESE